MPRNVYHEINLHLTWHTKNNSPILTPQIESRLHHYLEHRVITTPGVIFHEVGGTEDHVHLAVSIPPTLLISDWIGKLKGASSHHVNHEVTKRKVLEWQVGYGVVSFGTKDLEWVKRYIRNQKLHHGSNDIVDRLERIEFDETEVEGESAE